MTDSSRAGVWRFVLRRWFHIALLALALYSVAQHHCPATIARVRADVSGDWDDPYCASHDERMNIFNVYELHRPPRRQGVPIGGHDPEMYRKFRELLLESRGSSRWYRLRLVRELAASSDPRDAITLTVVSESWSADLRAVAIEAAHDILRREAKPAGDCCRWQPAAGTCCARIVHCPLAHAPFVQSSRPRADIPSTDDSAH